MQPSTENLNKSEIAEFYKDKSIFITGATGFVGKVLIEKLLRSCPQLDKIYLIVRQKRGKTVDQRLDEIINCKLFEIVKNMYPNLKDKLICMEGDLLEPNIGLSAQDRETLVNNVSIIFHSAATVKFNEPMKVAVDMNIGGVKKMIQLAKELKNLKAFIHVSTAYVHCDNTFLKEEIYAPPTEPNKILEIANLLEEPLLNRITPDLLKAKPNTYIYTKTIAESLIEQECKEMPVSIVRPSMIGCAWREPFPGWVDTLFGPSFSFAAIGTGLFRTMMGNKDGIADFIPVDVTVNLLIAASWFVGTKKTNKIDVYNCTSGQINKFTWGNAEEFTVMAVNKNPFENIFWVPDFHYTKSKVVFLLKTQFLQRLPAHIADFLLKLMKKRPIFIKVQGKIKAMTSSIEYFTLHEWQFTNDNVFSLMKQLNPIDSRKFNFDIRDLKWKDYILDYSLGSKLYIMNEDTGRLKKCYKQLQKLQRIQRFLMISFYLIILNFVIFNTEIGNESVESIYSYAMSLYQVGLSSLISMQNAVEV